MVGQQNGRKEVGTEVKDKSKKWVQLSAAGTLQTTFSNAYRVTSEVH